MDFILEKKTRLQVFAIFGLNLSFLDYAGRTIFTLEGVASVFWFQKRLYVAMISGMGLI